MNASDNILDEILEETKSQLDPEEYQLSETDFYTARDLKECDFAEFQRDGRKSLKISLIDQSRNFISPEK